MLSLVSLTYACFLGLVYINLDDLFVFSPCQYTRGHKFKLFKCQTCVCANLFSERVGILFATLLILVPF